MSEVMTVAAIIGILAAIAVPNFIKFQARSKQAEARSNLKAAFTSQRAFYAGKDRYSSIPLEVGFQPERNNRYAYFFAHTVLLDDRSGTTISGAANATAV